MSETVHHTESGNLSGKELVVILISFGLFAVLEYGFVHRTDAVGLLFVVSAFVYFLKLYLYYGIATLAFYRKTWMLATAAIIVYIVAYQLSDSTTVWAQLFNWSTILFGSLIMGTLLIKDANYQRIYTYGLLAVTLCAIVMYAPLWEILISSFKSNSSELVESLRTTLPASGYTTDESATLMDSLTNSMAMTAYIIPALTVMSSVMQYSIGFLIFLYIMIRKREIIKPIASFKMWKMPYYVAGVVIVGALMHFVGNELIAQIGDNLLVFLSVYYVICGLSLLEFFLTKIKMHWSLKFGLYLLLALTAHYGYIAFVILGFVDSFKDFRKIELLNLQSK